MRVRGKRWDESGVRVWGRGGKQERHGVSEEKSGRGNKTKVKGI